jgi:hypothetical protein
MFSGMLAEGSSGDMKSLLAPVLLLVSCHPIPDSSNKPELPISLECDAPVDEEFLYDGHTVSVSRKHCIDKMGPDRDGYYEFYYDYELFEFSLGAMMLRGRAYADDLEAHLLGVRIDGSSDSLQLRTTRRLLRAAVGYFRARQDAARLARSFERAEWLFPDPVARAAGAPSRFCVTNE